MRALPSLALSAAVLAVSVSASFAQNGSVSQLADDVYSIHLLGYSSLVVIGNNGVLITDTANPYRAELLKTEISKLTDKPVTQIVLTHEHFDHTGGTGVFEDAEIIAQGNARSFHSVDPLGSFPDQIDVTFDDTLSIDMGTTNVVLKHFGPADGVAATIVHLPDDKIAMSADLYGDQYLTPGMFLTDTNQLGVRLVLNEMANWDLEHAVNAHSQSTNPKSIAETAAFFNALYDGISPEVQRILKEDPANAFSKIIEMADAFELPEYSGWGNYDSLPTHARKMAFAIMHGG